VDIRRRTPVF